MLVIEEDGVVPMCVTLTITPPTATNSRNLTLNLTSSDGTGIAPQYEALNSLFLVLAIATMDYNAVDVDVIFSPGSINGSMQCINISALDGDVLESPKTFNVTLTTASTVILEQGATSITITDSTTGSYIH